MALSTELLKRLNSEEEPLPKRLKLAETTFRAVDLPIIRKEDLILQWFCETCITDQSAWSFLKRCLMTETFDVKVNIKKLLINVIIEKLNEHVSNICTDVLECCRLLVSNTGMQQYFISEPKDLGLLVKSLLDCILQLFKHIFNIEEESARGIDITLINNSNGLALIAYNTVISITESIIQIFKSSITTKDDLRIIFISDILYSLCAIIDHKCMDSTNRLGAVTHKCVQHLMLGKKYMQSKVLMKEEGVSGYKNSLSILADTAKQKDCQSNVTTFTFIFRVTVSAYKSDGIILDAIFRELIELAGMHEKEILSSLLKHMNDITFNFDNKVNSITLFEYFCNIIDGIISRDTLTKTDYNILIQLLYLNPLMIEKKLQQILQKIFLGKPTPEYEELIIALLNASIRLRREEKLLSHILISLKHCTNESTNVKFRQFFPHEFKRIFVKSMNNVTNSQTVAMLKTLIFHLNTDCAEILQCNEPYKNLSLLKATVELLVAVLEGVTIFEYAGTLAFHEKFINAFDELSNVLSLLIAKALHLNHNKEIIVTLLSAVLLWNEVKDALKYYVPKAFTKDLIFPILDDHWQQLVQRITNFGEENCQNSMNTIILQRLKTFEGTSSESCIKLNSLIGGLESSWSFILKSNTAIVPLLSNKEVTKMTCLLLADMTASKDNFEQWVTILSKDCLQENRNFVISLLSTVLVQIGNLSAEGLTKSITKYLNTKSLMEIETYGAKEDNEVVIGMKEELSRNKWTQLKDTISDEIKLNLEVLLHLPLMYLSTDVRLIAFVAIYATRRECQNYKKIILLCDTILSDLLEKSGLNILQYIEPVMLLDQLAESKVFQKAFEQSIRNVSSYTILRNLIKGSAHCKKTMCLLLECIQNVKSRLNAEQKLHFKKAEVKLSKVILKTFTEEIKDVTDIKMLTLALKVGISNNSLDENLKGIAESTFCNIFAGSITFNYEDKNELVEETLDLAIIILRNRKIFNVSNETVKLLWSKMLIRSCKDLLSPLLESSSPKELHELLKLLNIEMKKNLTCAKEDAIENIFTIWNIILKTSMSPERNRIRLAMINKLVCTIQIVHIPQKCWLNLLILLQNVLAAKHLHLPDYFVDMSILLGLQAIEDLTISACNDALILCGILLKVRTSLITDRLPALLLLYRQIFFTIVNTSKTITDKSEEYTVKCLMLDVEKFTSSLIKLKKDMIRLSPYLITDLLKLFSEASTTTSVKMSLQNCINQLISICDQYGIALLSRTLPISMQEIFKVQLDTFKKFYKYTGKI